MCALCAGQCVLKSPQHDKVPAWMWCHAVGDVVEDLSVVLQALNDAAVQQVLVPQMALPQDPLQHHAGRRLHLC